HPPPGRAPLPARRRPRNAHRARRLVRTGQRGALGGGRPAATGAEPLEPQLGDSDRNSEMREGGAIRDSDLNSIGTAATCVRAAELRSLSLISPPPSSPNSEVRSLSLRDAAVEAELGIRFEDEGSLELP